VIEKNANCKIKRSFRYTFVATFVIFLLVFNFLPAALGQEEISPDLRRVQKFDAQGNYITSWGVNGTGTGQFLHIHGIALDTRGNLLAADEKKNEIQKFDTQGNFITGWGSEGEGAEQFSSKIEDIGVDSDDNVYVVDYGSNRIQKYADNGTFITSWGQKGSQAAQFDRPWGVAFDSRGDVYVTDRENQRVQKFYSNGTFILSWGSNGTSSGQFLKPAGIVVDKTDSVYVVDEGKNEIQKFDTQGNFITRWGSKGNAAGQFNEPHGISADSSGNIYVADTGNTRIQKFNPQGAYIDSWGKIGISEGEFLFPTDVAINQIDSTVFVSDQKLQHPEKNIVNTFLIPQPSVSDLAPDQPQLLIDLVIQEPTTSLGSAQLVEASVYATNSTDQIIERATVNLTVSDPSGNIVSEFSDDDGGVSEDVATDPDSEPGLYTVEVEAAAEGYASASASKTFEIVG
jgi:DNA-binding beta-propeller fold protein YncE